MLTRVDPVSVFKIFFKKKNQLYVSVSVSSFLFSIFGIDFVFLAQASQLPTQSEVWRTKERAFYPLTDSECGLIGAKARSLSTGVSKNLFARFLIDGEELLLVGAHLIAQATTPERCAQREGQAVVLADEIRKQRAAKPGIGALVLGDLVSALFQNAFLDCFKIQIVQILSNSKKKSNLIYLYLNCSI